MRNGRREFTGKVFRMGVSRWEPIRCIKGFDDSFRGYMRGYVEVSLKTEFVTHVAVKEGLTLSATHL